jgi:hypothetical protein
MLILDLVPVNLSLLSVDHRPCRTFAVVLLEQLAPVNHIFQGGRGLPFNASSLLPIANFSSPALIPPAIHRSSARLANTFIRSRRCKSAINSSTLGTSLRECRNQACHCAEISQPPKPSTGLTCQCIRCPIFLFSVLHHASFAARGLMLAHGEIQVSFEVMAGEKLQVRLDGGMGWGEMTFRRQGRWRERYL